MSNEISVTTDLRITVDNLQYASLPQSYNADISVGRGPSPGVLTVPTTGIDADFSILTQPGLCRIMNLDATNYVEYGIEDPETGKFYPVGELLAGEFTVLRLSRNLGEEQGVGSSSATTGPTTNTFHLRADTATCDVLVEAFDT